MDRNRQRHDDPIEDAMLIFAHIANQLSEIKEFVVPSYHPERHYMRGPGPACARLVRAAHPETAELRRS